VIVKPAKSKITGPPLKVMQVAVAVEPMFWVR
jgi:hypothetical protein